MLAGAASADSRSLVEESAADNWRSPLGSLQHTAASSADSSRTAAVVALGKFDALHRGHRLLAEQAASMEGAPWLISFSGMAQELGASLASADRYTKNLMQMCQLDYSMQV